jgi:putative transposase
MGNHHTILGQVLQLIPRFEFENAVKLTGTEYHARGFSSWSHFSAMLFGQLSGQDNLRGIAAGLVSQHQCMYHLGIERVSRSTLAYANEHRSFALFEHIFAYMLSKCKDVSPRHKFRFKNPVFSIDATTIKLCLNLYNWAKFRTRKGAVKLHVKLNHAGYLPEFMLMTTGKVHETKVAPMIPVNQGDIFVVDRGYTDFNWFKELDDKGAFFVTRLKKNSYYCVTERRDVSAFENIYSDQVIELKGFYSSRKFPGKLRRIRSRDPETDKIIVILTNNFDWSAQTIAKLYKDRWQIELFFKTIKQQLKVKSFVGTSPNALLSQLWVALIAYLMLSYLKYKSRFIWSLYTLCSILPANLFARRNLWDWLNDPYQSVSRNNLQLSFSFG